jgi:hypothetical protein
MKDADNLDRLRFDPALKLACGRLPDTGPDLCSQPTVSLCENAPSLSDLIRPMGMMVDLYCASYTKPPDAVWRRQGGRQNRRIRPPVCRALNERPHQKQVAMRAAQLRLFLPNLLVLASERSDAQAPMLFSGGPWPAHVLFDKAGSHDQGAAAKCTSRKLGDQSAEIQPVRPDDRARLSAAYQSADDLRSDPATDDAGQQVADDAKVVPFDRRTDDTAAHSASYQLKYETCHSAPHFKPPHGNPPVQ